MLGPKQQQWVDALVSGKYKQGVKILCDKQDRYCCLGVAKEVFQLDTKDRCYLTNYTYKELGLWSVQGSFSSAIEVYGKTYYSLVDMNDKGLTFQDIALIIQNYWHLIFTEAV